ECNRRSLERNTARGCRRRRSVLHADRPRPARRCIPADANSRRGLFRDIYRAGASVLAASGQATSSGLGRRFEPMKRWLVLGAWVLGVSIGAPLAALLLLYAFSDTWAGRRLIEDAVVLGSGGRVEIRGLAGEFPRKPTIDHVEIADKEGV